MSHKHALAKSRAVDRGLHRERNAAQRLHRLIPCVEGQRHKRRTYRRDTQPELPSNAVTEIGRAELRKRQAAGRDSTSGALENALRSGDAKAVELLDVIDLHSTAHD